MPTVAAGELASLGRTSYIWLPGLAIFAPGHQSYLWHQTELSTLDPRASRAIDPAWPLRSAVAWRPNDQSRRIPA
jgi:hypothetical protein